MTTINAGTGEQNVPNPIYIPVTPSLDETRLVAGYTMLPHVQAFVDAVAVATAEHSFGTYIGHDPTVDRAVDMFTPLDSRTLGDAICAFAIANMDAYGIWYIIYRQHIYNPEIGKYWRLMEDRGSPTQNHMDHVHASFYATGGTLPPTPPTPPVQTKEYEVSYVTVLAGERLLIPVPVVGGGAGVKKAAVTVTAPDPGAIIGIAWTWRNEKPIPGLHHNPSFKGIVNFQLETGVEAVEIENKSPVVAVTVMIETIA